MTGLEMRQSVIRGLPTGWWEGGPAGAPILLLLHGFPDEPSSWEAQATNFLGRYRVVCPFNRGMGPSSGGAVERYSLDSVTLDLLTLLDQVDGDRNRVTIVGHDIGAALAWHLAGLLANRCQALGIVNGMSVPQMVRRLGKWRQQLRSWYIYTLQLPVLPEWVMERFGAQIIRRTPRPGDPVPPGHNLAQTLNHYRAFVRGALKRDVPRPLRVPVLVLWGQQDPYLLVPTVDELAPFALRLQTRILDGGHWIHQERAREVNQALRQFFEEVQDGTFQSSFSDSRRSGTSPAQSPR